MELLIRQHLSAVQNDQDNHHLKKAYKLMKAASTERSAIDSSDSFSSDLYVLCAEQALQIGNSEMSHDCLKVYFDGKPASNQFLGRAYLCQGQLHIPQSVDSLEELEKCVGYFLKAIEFAKHQQRYYFLVYNASVLFWQMARPFVKCGYRHRLIPGLTEIIKALEQAEDKDHDWRAELMVELLECLLDAQKLKEAKDLASTASEYIKVNAPHRYQQLFSMMVYHKLMDPTKAAKEMKGSVSLSVIYNIQKLRSTLSTPSHLSQSQSKDSSKETTANLNEIYKLLVNADKETSSDLICDRKVSFLLELAHLCLEFNCAQLAHTCISDLNISDITDPGKLIEIECLKCEYEVQKLGDKITTYSKSAVESLLKLIRRLEVTLENAVRLSNPNIIQVACASLWNLCLPLLQHNLRKHLRKPLLCVAENLEKIDSLLILLRCQVHLEVAQIEEDEDRIEVAIEHLQKAMLLDQGQYQDQLKMSFHRLNLCAMLYRKPERFEDQAAMMIAQAKKGSQKDGVRKKRSLLVDAGLALASSAFQMVLDSENEAKVSTGKSAKGQISYLCMKAQHHTKCVQKTGEHFTSLEVQNDAERVRLWGDLAKVARKQEVWDVCRTACRFCLLYDDGRWKVPKLDNLQKRRSGVSGVGENRNSLLESESSLLKQSFGSERDLLRLLAEIRFINAEATIHLLRSEGCLLNDYPVPPEDKSKHPMGYVAKSADEDPDWLAYRDWIRHLSQYATENFVKAAELGAELGEAWITHNSVVYILNHNKHLITSRRHAELVNTLQTLLNAIKQTGHNGNTVLLVMLSNALAQGLIFQWIPASTKKTTEAPTQAEKSKKVAGKGPEKSTIAQVLLVDPIALPDLKTALEVCEFVLDLTNGSRPDELVPIAIRQQIIATWVKVKHILQQQIGQKLGTDDENNNEGQNPMTKVLVALEMYSCNGLGFMDFTVPSLSQLVKMCSEYTWSDRLVELQSLVRIAHFCYNSHDYELAKSCSQRALDMDEPPRCSDGMKKPETHDYTLEQEMLSTAACIQGQSIMESLDGKKHLHMLALKAFQTSARYAGEATCIRLVMQAAKHFWSACLPLISSPAERDALKEPTISILKAISNAESKNKQGTQNDVTFLHLWPTMDVQISETPHNNLSTGTAISEEDLALRAALYGLLFHMYADNNNWESGLNVLDEAIRILPRSKHKLLIFKQRVLVKARLGCNFLMDIQKCKDESEESLSYTWHRLALTSKDTVEQLACYQNAIDALQKSESEWQKVDYLMELAEWLYFKQFTVTDALCQLDWAISILLKMKLTKSAKEEEKTLKVKSKPRSKYSSGKDPKREDMKQFDTEGVAKMESLVLANPMSENEMEVITFNPIDDIRNVRQLEYLVRAHTIIAVMSGHSSPHHQQHCLMAYAYIMHIWKISLPAAGVVIKTLAKNPPNSAPQNPQSASSKKGKSQKETKQVQPAPVREKPKRKGPIDALPVSVEEWASYDCPDEVRDAFKADTSGYAVNKNNILKPTYSLYYLDLLVKEMQSISLTHLTIPVLQLAEVIAHEVAESKSLSDLYHLRISQVCQDLKLSQSASYHEKAVGRVYISEMEQVICRQEINLQKKKIKQIKREGTNGIGEVSHPDISDFSNRSFTSKDKIMDLDATPGKGLSGLSLPYLWIDKGDVLIQLGLYQPARLLLAEAHRATQEMGDKYAVSRCLYLLAVLANNEKNHGQAKALLEEAQRIEGGTEFWYKITLSLVQAVLGEQKEGKEKMACTILQTTINAFKNLLHDRKNRGSELGFFISSLEARRILIQTKSFQDLSTMNVRSPQVAVKLLEACDKMSQIENDLVEYGYKENSAEIMMQHANAQRLLALHTEDEDQKHYHYVEAYTIAQRAVCMEAEVLYDIQSLLTLQEMRGISLPIMRRLASMKLSLVELALDMLQLVCIEREKNIQEEKQKGSIHRIIEEFVRSTPDYTSIDQEWTATGRILSHTALSNLASIQTLHAGCFDIKSQCLYLTGKCLRLLATKVDPLSPDTYWNENILDEAKLGTETSLMAAEEPHENKLTFGDLQSNNKQHKSYIKKAKELRVRRALAQKYLSQATEVLLQSMNVAMNNNIIPTLDSASLETVLCLGVFDPTSAGQYLALHQSCRASIMMEEILRTATSDTSSSQLAALLQLQYHLKEKGDMTSSLFKSVEQRLTATSKAWENLLIQSQHLNIVNELPPNFNIIIIQHSEDRSFLYGAVLEKSKSNVVQKGKSSQQGMKSQVVRCAVDPNLLLDLLEKMQLYKQEVMQGLLKREYQHSINTQKTGFDTMQAVPQNTVLVAENKEDKDLQRLSSYFYEVVKAMDTYLKPLLLQLNFSCFRKQVLLSSANESVKAKAKGKEDKPTPEPVKVKAKEKEDTSITAQGIPGPPTEMGECVILLTDKLLMELPLEALGVLEEEGICSVSRDFSLQMLYNRFHKDEPKSEAKREAKSAKEPKPKLEHKKNVKLAPINHVLPPNCIQVDTHHFRYIVDPYNEAKEPESVSPAHMIKEVLQQHNPFTLSWDGFIGCHHVPSHAEWEHLMKNCSAFLFYGTERFLSHVLVEKIVPMNFSECQLMILLDLVQTNNSFLRQSNLDAEKSVLYLSLEKPIETAVLLSLTGVRSIMANQWHTTLEQNAKRLMSITENLLGIGKTTGQTIHDLTKVGAPQLIAKVNEDSSHSDEGTREALLSSDQSNVLAIQPASYSYVLYGLPNLVVM